MKKLRNKFTIILGFSSVHFILGLAALGKSLSMGMSRFDTGETAGFFEDAISFMATLFIFPCFQLTKWLFNLGLLLDPTRKPLLKEIFLGPGWLVLKFLHSLLWAVCGYYFIVYIQRRIKKG